LASRCKHLVVSALENFGFGKRPAQQALVFSPFILEENIAMRMVMILVHARGAAKSNLTDTNKDIGLRHRRATKKEI